MNETTIDDSPLQRLREIALEVNGIDVDCYKKFHQDPHRPILGLENADAQWCFFGRDPGKHEVQFQMPFIGEAGQRVRAVMVECGVRPDQVYWMNTVPFKPIGNKRWSLKVQRQCQPALLELLGMWNGASIVTFGEDALKWFGLLSPKHHKTIDDLWASNEKFKSHLRISIEIGTTERSVTLYPVPHPSTKNAAWASRFPLILASRLRTAAAG